MTRVSGTTRRLLTAFGVFFLILGAASYFALAGLAEVSAAVHDVSRANSGMRTALQLASAVRDQYAHQAHTIILGDDTHLGMHRESSQRVQALLAQLDAELYDPAQRELIREIATSTEEMNRRFLTAVVPAVLRGDQETVGREHARVLQLVFFVQDRADHMATLYAAAITQAEGRAAEVEAAAARYVMLSQVGALVFAAAMALYIGRSVARPLARLEGGAARLARGDLDTVLPVGSDDEFGRLAGQFNAMTAALKEHQTRLVQHEKLAAIGRLAAGVAHEINNPLGVILGYVRLLKKRGSPDVLEDLKVIEEEAVRCQVIVEGLLDLARPWRQSPEGVDLRELCGGVISRLVDAQKLRGVAVEVVGDAHTEGNDPALRQVVSNLVINAAEAAGAGGWVRVALAAEPDGGASLTFTDSGPGLSPEARQHLFEAFFTTKALGTGLGLAVCQAIVQAHGGSIEAGTAPGGGASFRVHLPGPEKSRGGA